MASDKVYLLGLLVILWFGFALANRVVYRGWHNWPWRKCGGCGGRFASIKHVEHTLYD